MSTVLKRLFFVCPCVVILLGLSLASPGAQGANNACSLSTNNYAETFSNLAYGPTSTWDSRISNVEGWGFSNGIYAGMRSGAWPTNAQTPQLVQLGSRVRTAASGLLANAPTYSRPVAFLTDQGGCQVIVQKFDNFIGYNKTPSSFNGRLTVDTAADCRPGAILATIPYDLLPFTGRSSIVVFSPLNTVFDGTVHSATLYRASTSEKWSKVDFTAIVQSAQISLHGGSPIAFQDIDGDGRPDMLVASSTGSVNQLVVFYADDLSVDDWTFSSYEVLIPDLGFKPPFASASQPAQAGPACATTSSMVSRGVTGLDTGDFNGDGLTDLVFSSASEPNLRVFLGSSRNTFAHGFDLGTPGGAGVTYVYAEDFNGDGQDDLLMIEDGRGCKGNPAHGQVLYATSPGVFSSTSVPLPADTLEIEWATKQRVTATNPQGQDPTGHQVPLFNAFLGEGDDAGTFKFWYNMPNSNYYTPTTIGRSTVVDTPKSNQGNLASTRLTSLNQSTPPGTSLTYYVSANGGTTWEQLSSQELAGQSHTFDALGTQFVWQVIFNNSKKNQTGPDAGYSQAATATGRLDNLAFANSWASARQFSRSSPTYGSVNKGGTVTDYVYSSAFDLPQFTGHLTAQSLSSVKSGNANSLQLIGVASSWDAGAILGTASSAGRNVSAAQPVSTTASSTDNTVAYSDRKIDFSAAQLTAKTNTPLLVQQLRLPTSRASSLLGALRSGVSGTGNNALRDTGHGSPVFVGAPNQDPNYMGNNYSNFVAAQQNRQPFVLLGANDGMLHAFDAASGAELWAMVPSNLLSLLNREIGYDSNGALQLLHVASVDGPITVGDVYTSAQGWRTIAVVGQGDGTSADGRNFYFAVDVTDPTSPQWLWEMTQSPVGSKGTCDPNPCNQVTCSYSCTTATSNCTAQNKAFSAEMDLRNTRLDGLNSYGLLEAEHYTSEQQGTAPAQVDWVPVADGSTAAKAARNQSFMRPSTSANGCNQSSLKDAYQSCAQLSYRISAANAFATAYPLFRVFQGTGSKLSYTIDNTSYWSGTLTKLGSPINGWQWMTGGSVSLPAGNHVLTLFMVDAALAIDAVAISNRQAALSAGVVETPTTVCPQTCTSSGCSTSCLTSPSTQEWPSCGVGNKQRCCDAGNGLGYCVAQGSACSGTPASMGRAYSPAALGRIATSVGNKWVAFFGSGNASDATFPRQGMSLYMVDAVTGQPMASWMVSAVTAPSATPSQLPAVQAGPTLVDVDNDGNVDRVYFADLAGRLWKLNTQATAGLAASGAMTSPSQFATCQKFDAGDPAQTGARQWAPIYQPPKAAILTSGTANIYFGTGVLPKVTTTLASAFYSLRDSDALTACSSTPRKVSSLSAADGEWVVTEPAANRRNFSEATLVGGTAIYFTSYDANADAANICAASMSGSNLYGLAVRSFTASTGMNYKAGKSLLGGSTQYMSLTGTIRSAGVTRSAPQSPIVHAQATVLSATDVLLQQLTGETARISTPQQQNLLKSRLQPIRFRTIQPQ